MTKVLIVTPFYPLPENKNGVNKIIFHLLKENPYYKADVLTLFTEEDIKYFDQEKVFNSKFFKIKANYFDRKSLFLKWIFSKYPFNVVKQQLNFDKIKQEIIKLHENYDVIHFATPFLFPILKDLNAEILKKVILFPIDSFTYFTKNRINSSKIFNRIPFYIDYIKWKNLEKNIYKKFSKKVFFVSDKDSKFVNSFDKNIKTFFIPNGVDIKYFKKLNNNYEKNSIIFTGNMSYAPNKDAVMLLLYEILPLVKKEIPDIKVYIVGMNADKEFKDINMKNVIIKGYVKDIREWINKAEIFVSPLRFGSGIKNKVLEAMAMEKVVIGTDISFEGIDGENVYIKSSKNPKDFANKIIEVLKNKPVEIEKNARKLIEEKYSWDFIRKKYGEVYENSISN